MLITIEGADGVGKSSFAAALVDTLRTSAIAGQLWKTHYGAEHCDAQLLKFPRYDTPTGQRIREYLAGDANEVSPMQACELYAMDRLAARDELCRAKLSVMPLIIDRYVESNVAHQMARVGAPAEHPAPLDHGHAAMLRRMYEREYIDNALPYPDVIFYLKCDPALSRAALTDRDTPDHHEAHEDYQTRVHAWYERIMNPFRSEPLQLPPGLHIRHEHTGKLSERSGVRATPRELAEAAAEKLLPILVSMRPAARVAFF